MTHMPNWLKASKMEQAAKRVEKGEDVRVVMDELGFISKSEADDIFWSDAFRHEPGMFNEQPAEITPEAVRSRFWSEYKRRKALTT